MASNQRQYKLNQGQLRICMPVEIDNGQATRNSDITEKVQIIQKIMSRH